MIRLTPEQVAEAERHPEGLRVEADGTDKTFVIVEESVLRRLQPVIEQGDIHESL